MVDQRNVTNFAVVTTITGSMTNVSPGNGGTFSIALATNWPTANFCVVIDSEIIRCSSRSGTTCTVATSGRGYNGTTAASHSSGAQIMHEAVALDYQDPNDHMLASAGVHGLAGTVVGTTDSQTLTNKTIDGASNTINNVVENSAIIDTGSVAVTIAVSKTFISQSVTVPTNCTMVELTVTMINLSAVAQWFNFYQATLGAVAFVPDNQRFCDGMSGTSNFAQSWSVWQSAPLTGARTFVLTCPSPQSTGNMRAVALLKFIC